MNNSKLAFVRVGCLSLSVSRGIKDTLLFSPGEVIPVIEENVQDFQHAGDIITETADGERRFVSKQWVNILEGYSPGNGFIKLEDASDIVGVAMKLFLEGKSVYNLPRNSVDIFKTAAGVVEDHFVNTVFADEE